MICENSKCKKEHDGSFATGRFCSRSCANVFANGDDSKKKEKNLKISNSLKGRKLVRRAKYESIRCTNCGRIFERKLKNKKEQNFCSFRCWCDFKKRDISDKQKYRIECKFKFNIYEYPDNFDLNIITKFGWYSAFNRGNNHNGISRDHMFSVEDGFKNKIPPKIISHPANCKLLFQKDNAKKHGKSCISIEDLTKRILEWDDNIQRKLC